MRPSTFTSASSKKIHSLQSTVNRAVIILAFFGMLVTLHLGIQEHREFDKGCTGFDLPESVEAVFDCGVVVNSNAGEVLGISNSIWGFLFYFFIAGITLILQFFRGRFALPLLRIREIVVLSGFCYTLFLVYYQTFVVRAFCALCLVSAVLVSTLFVLHAVDYRRRKVRPHPFIRPATIVREVRFAASLVVLTLILAGADLAYFSRLDQAQNVLPLQLNCYYKADTVDGFRSLLTGGEPVAGNANSQVIVVEIFEPNCGHCRNLHPVMKNLITRYGDVAQFYIIPVLFYPAPSYMQVAALIEAVEQKKYFEMLELQFERQKQGGLSLDELKAIAEEIGMDPERMIDRIETRAYSQRILDRRNKIVNEFGIRSVPTVMINGRIVATRSQECLSRLIEDAVESTR